MEIFAKVMFGLVVAVAAVFVLVTVLFGSKSDAMSGGSSQIRTTYRGKPGFDDFVSRMTLTLGVIFMALCLAINVVQAHNPTGAAQAPPSRQTPAP